MGFGIKEIPYQMKLGKDIKSVSNLAQTCRDQEHDLDFIMIDICHALNYRTHSTIESRDIAATRSDTSIKGSYWGDFIVVKINSYLTDCDSKYEHVRLRSEAIISQEISFAMHLGVPGVSIDLPVGRNIDNFARILNQYLQNVHTSTKFYIRMVVSGKFEEDELTYNKFTVLKQICGHSQQLALIIELGQDIPDWGQYLKRFTSERIFAVLLDVNCFINNAKGFPVLSKHHQTTCKELMKLQVSFVLRGKHANDRIDNYYQYLCYLFKNHDVLDVEEKIEVPYRNYLQSPLQPLADNLESSTYETFENDTIKYDLYEEAMFKAFIDKKTTGKFQQTKQVSKGEQEEEAKKQNESMAIDKDQEIVVMYFGAGRGPLIRKALKAAQKAEVKVRVIALDKNPNAIVTLRNMIVDENLEDRVTLFAGDMRKIDINDLQGDILVSELLGSFGDNELSPECLIPTEKYLRKGGIYMPWSYTNYVVPLSSQILWGEVNLYVQQGISARVPISQQLYPFELPYVVKIFSPGYPCGPKPQEVFTFRHLPYPDREDMKDLPQGENQSLKMYDKKTFTVTEQQSEIHGFAGFFTAELYQDIFYSTHPESHTPGMHSWFPMFFPIKDPFLVFRGQEVSISIWRNNSQAKVWYEWSMSVYDLELDRIMLSSPVHNVNGRGFSIGL